MHESAGTNTVNLTPVDKNETEYSETASLYYWKKQTFLLLLINSCFGNPVNPTIIYLWATLD